MLYRRSFKDRVLSTPVALLMLAALILSACQLDQLLGQKDANLDEGISAAEDNIGAPSVVMDVPVTLSGVVAITDATQAASKVLGKTVSRAVTDPADCAKFFDPNDNAMIDGYRMTRFLVGLSLSQSCFADFIIQGVAAGARVFDGKGLIELPANPNDPGAPSHLQLAHSGFTYQLWMYFAADRAALDTAKDKVIYITWTTSTYETTGSMVMLRLEDPNDPNAPSNLRIDFKRSETKASNEIFLGFKQDHAGGMKGFRVEMLEDKSGVESIYSVRGNLEFAKQPNAASLPTDESFPPVRITVNAIANASGAGVAIWSLKDLAFAIENTDFNLGSYVMSLSNRSYFEQTGVLSWIYRGISDGKYVNTSGTNSRTANTAAIIDCLEGPASVDCNVGVVGMDLGAGYFVDPCASTNGADCTKFMQGYYDQGAFNFLGDITNSAAADEPIGDLKTQVDALVEFDSLFPEGETEETIFTAPVI